MTQSEGIAVLRDMIFGVWVSKAISVAADLAIADVLRDGPRSSAEIAAAVNATEDGVYRLLRALSAVGVFAEHEGRRFALAPLGDHLRSDRADSLRGLARFVCDDMHWRAWGSLGAGIRGGGSVFKRVFGVSPFDHLAANPEVAAVFNEAMTSISSMEAHAVTTAYDFSGIGKLADVAGGHGGLLAAILSANPSIRGVLFEMSHALEGAQRLFRERGLAERCEVVSGDFFADVPAGCDAYLLKHVIHDWDDERSVAILCNVRKAMKTTDKLLVVEMVVPPPGEPHFAKLLDLEMIALTEQGRERTVEEFAELYRQAGFRLSRIVPTTSGLSVIEGLPS